MDGTRSALIIASDQYTDPGLSQLRAPASDAQALAAVLTDPEVGDFEVRTLLNQPAHEVNLAVEEFFADRRPDDLLLVHFSCHGVKDEAGELHFATPNTQLRRLGATAVAAEFVNRQMSRSRSRRIVLLLDCCYAGAFERGMTARSGTQMGVQEQLGGRGRAVITASSAMEYAFEGNELSHRGEAVPSVFTSALVEGLETGDADRDQDGLIALDELYDYVYDKVRAVTPHQTPGKWTFGVQGDLYIARCSRPVTTPRPQPPELALSVGHPPEGAPAAPGRSRPGPQLDPAPPQVPPGGDLLRIAGGLMIAGAVVRFIGLFLPYLPTDGQKFLLVHGSWSRWYGLVMTAIALTAGICTLVPHTRRLIGPGLLLGAVPVATWGLVFLVSDGRAQSGFGSGFWLQIAAELIQVIAAVLAWAELVHAGEVRLVRRLPRDVLPWVVAVLGGAGALMLVLIEEILRGAGIHLWVASVIWAAALAVVVPLAAVAVAPRRFGAFLLIGWIGSAAAFLVYYYQLMGYFQRDSYGVSRGPLIAFGGTLLALSAAAIPLARITPPRTTAGPGAN